ncbi:hypothetical protein ACRTC3_21645 [Photobacterium damselae]|uniref:hypothetical protein n=1 Tax=Photobacterium damselae TaxID=38293 RepID=UPI003D7F0277
MDLGVVGIIISIVAIVIGLLCWMFPPTIITNKFKSYSLVSYVNTLKMRCKYRVAIVDDEISSYPVDYIKNLGFEVLEYETISFASAKDLINHDVLLLDVKGVVKEDPDEGGAKLIKIIKETRPLLPVVAVSSGYFHTELNDYFKSSDATVNKPIDEYKIRELLFELKKEFFDADEISLRLENTIKKLDINKSKKNQMYKFIIEFLSDKTSKTELLDFIHQNAKSDSKDIIDNVNVLKDRVVHD